jgi:hypothetical protein
MRREDGGQAQATILAGALNNQSESKRMRLSRVGGTLPSHTILHFGLAPLAKPSPAGPVVVRFGHRIGLK